NRACGFIHSIFVTVPFRVTGLAESYSAAKEWCAHAAVTIIIIAASNRTNLFFITFSSRHFTPISTERQIRSAALNNHRCMAGVHGSGRSKLIPSAFQAEDSLCNGFFLQ